MSRNRVVDEIDYSRVEPVTTEWVPMALQAEVAVIDSILLSSEFVPKIIKEVGLLPADFVSEDRGLTWQVMCELYAEGIPVDIHLVRTRITTITRGRNVSVGISDNVATALYAVDYAREVKRAAYNRNLLPYIEQITRIAYKNLPISEARAQLLKASEFMSISDGDKGLIFAKQFVVAEVERVLRIHESGIIPGFMTGFFMLDRLLGGFQKSDLVVIGARPGLGKTAFILSIIENLRKRVNPNVAYFSLEMTSEQLMGRLLSMISGIDSHRLRMGQIADDEVSILYEAANELITANLFIDDAAASPVEHIVAESRQLKKQLEAEGRESDMIVIDHMHIMGDGGRNWDDNTKYRFITYTLKNLAKELGIPVVALSQLSRAMLDKEDKRPALNFFRGSGGIEENADTVIALHREGYYNNECEEPCIAEIIVLKHRHGATGTIKLFYRAELTQFRDLEIVRTDFDQ